MFIFLILFIIKHLFWPSTHGKAQLPQLSVSILHAFHLYCILLCTSRSIQSIIVLAVPTGDSIKQMPESHNHNYYYCYYCFCWYYYYYSKNKGKEALSFRCKHLFLGLLHALWQTCYTDVESNILLAGLLLGSWNFPQCICPSASKCPALSSDYSVETAVENGRSL